MDKNLFQVNILGTSFSIQTDEDPGRMEEIVDYLKKKTAAVESGLSIKDPLKNLIISSIILIDELQKEKQMLIDGRGSDFDEVERLTLQIMERIDKSLE
ncbi:MAG: cell division protein ZapA [Spirochaetales bacterium]|nr:cell division protein ZapA [Spirochaetales bacterium]